MLTVENLNTYYGNSHALKGLSFSVESGELVTVIGSNGAGKSTLLRAISGLIPIRSGTITFMGQKLNNMKPHQIVSLGLSHCPEGRHLFAPLTVFENLKMGFFQRKAPQEFDTSIQQIYELFPILKERSSQKAGTLSGGEQQMLAIGRALMAQPKLLVLDEPSLGLAPILVHKIFETLVELLNRGVTILLVEQNAKMALKIASRGYVLELGNITMQGTGDSLLNNEAVINAYLGGGQNDSI